MNGREPWIIVVVDNQEQGLRFMRQLGLDKAKLAAGDDAIRQVEGARPDVIYDLRRYWHGSRQAERVTDAIDHMRLMRDKGALEWLRRV